MNHPREPQDIEIIAEMLALARSGRFHSAAPFLEAAAQLFPGVSVERLRNCAGQLGVMLKKAGE